MLFECPSIFCSRFERRRRADTHCILNVAATLRNIVVIVIIFLLTKVGLSPDMVIAHSSLLMGLFGSIIPDQTRWYIATFATIIAIAAIGLAGNKILKMGEAVNEIESDDVPCCASCGLAEGDDVKLEDCSACKSVRYCSAKCQRVHRRQHKQECKERADAILFTQPESTHLGDCPICCLPLSHDVHKSTVIVCCCTLICDGCSYANAKRELEGKLQFSCPFCRCPTDQADLNLKKRVEANDAFAICLMGNRCYQEGDYSKAFEYYIKSAKLGDMNAHCLLSILYHHGRGVKKNETKRVYHLERAAIGGHPHARCELGDAEARHGRMDRAVRHWIIAANMGHDASLEALKDMYRDGLVSNKDLALALRAYQAAVDAMKSPQRSGAEQVQETLGLHSEG